MMNDKENLIMQDFVMQLEQIDLNIIVPIIIYYVTSKTLSTYSLHRDYKPKSISKVILPPELTIEYSEVDINKIATKKYGEAIIEFAEVMVKSFLAKDLINFYNNINDLKVKSQKFGIRNLILRSKLAGFYSPKKNRITIEEDFVEDTIYHELFHMSSSIYKNGKKYSGFHQSHLGKGINEGYTELLSRRYFKFENQVTKSYEYLTFIAGKLEEIIGREKMQSLYLNANLKGLIDELSEYISEDEIMKFISNTDFLINYMDDKKLQLFEKNMIGNCLKYVNRFLIFCYSKMLIKQVKDGKFSTNEEILPELIEYVKSLYSAITFHRHKYEIMNENDIQEILRAAFENDNITVSVVYENEEGIKR